MKAVAPDLDPVTAKVMLRWCTRWTSSRSGFDRPDRERGVSTSKPRCWRSIPSSHRLAGDLNRDGRVDGEDFGILLSGWGPCGGDCEDVCDGDINLDCQINGTDLGLLFIDWTG